MLDCKNIALLGSGLVECFLVSREDLLEAGYKHTEVEGIEADAARYRHLRDSWVRRCGASNNSRKRLEWHLPHIYSRGNTFPVQLDNSIDVEINQREKEGRLLP